MGLDQWLYAEKDGKETEEVAYWRKHPNLHGFMESLWAEKGKPGDSNEGFNGVHLYLDEADISRAEDAVKKEELPRTRGYFFGVSRINEDQQAEDLDALAQARGWLNKGYKVFYDSWW